MTTPEGKVKLWLDRQLDDWFPDHYRVKPRGGPFGRSGAPDYLVCWRGVFVGIEVKTDDGALTALQQKNLESIDRAGGVAAVMKGRDLDRLKAIRQAVLDRTT
jgi:hypothetical protein